jgi:type VI secretion system protein ImpJ
MDSLQHLNWKQGLFLKPQHFQQLSHNTADLAFNQAAAQSGNGAGLYHLSYDKEALTCGVLTILQCTAIMLDGTLLQYPGNCSLPSISLNQYEPDNSGIISISIGLMPLSRERSNLATTTQPNNRYSEHDTHDYADIFNTEDVVSVETLSYNTCLLMADTQAEAGVMQLPLCNIALVGGQYEMDPRFIAAVYYVQGSECLQRYIKSMKQSLLARYEQLESYNGLYSADGGGTNTRILFALQVITEAIPQFSHFDEVPSTPVSEVYLACRTLVAKLSNFSKLCTVTGDSSDPAVGLVPFSHSNLSECFARAFSLCQALLNQLTVSPELLVELQRQDNDFFVAPLAQDMLAQGNQYYIRLRSEQGLEELADNIIQFAKMGADSQVLIYLKRALPGVKLRYLHRKPLGVANKPNSYYFSIATDSFEWAQLLECQRIGFIWSEHPADLSVELIAVRG